MKLTLMRSEALEKWSCWTRLIEVEASVAQKVEH